MKRKPRAEEPSRFMTAMELARRWACSRTSVHRIARREGIPRLYLGSGRNGMVRYDRKEVEAYEASRRA